MRVEEIDERILPLATRVQMAESLRAETLQLVMKTDQESIGAPWAEYWREARNKYLALADTQGEFAAELKRGLHQGIHLV